MDNQDQRCLMMIIYFFTSRLNLKNLNIRTLLLIFILKIVFLFCFILNIMILLFSKLCSFVEQHFKICRPSHSVYPGRSSRKSWRQKVKYKERRHYLQVSISIFSNIKRDPIKGALLYQIRSFFEHCSNSR